MFPRLHIAFDPTAPAGSTVVAEPAAPSSDGQPSEPTPRSYRDRIEGLTGKSRDHWKLTGDLDGAEKLTTSDVRPASSPGTSETSEEVETEAASEPAVEEQPKVGETPEQKSARKKENDVRRLRNLGKVEAELAAERRHREVLEKQIAESKGAPATPKPADTPKALTEKPKRPRMDQFETVDAYEQALDTYEDSKERWDAQQVDSRLSKERQSVQQEQTESEWNTQIEKSRGTHKDFDAIVDKAQYSDATINVLRRMSDGAERGYLLGLNPGEARRIAELTDIPDFDNLLKVNPSRAAYLLGQAETRAEIELSKLVLKPAAAPKEKPPLKQVVATDKRPSLEVSLDQTSEPVSDPIQDALKRGDFTTYRRLMNKRELEERRTGAR